ncbi:hypothetical protein MHK08_12065, partial [Corynebacterium singulare]|nr:hypothetical protein [Corynebacterium singulare]
IEGHSITFELFGIPRHGGRLPFFPTQPGWISGVYQTGVRSGPGYTVAANTYGSPADLTADVLGAVEVLPAAPQVPAPPAAPTPQDLRDRACEELKRRVPSSSHVC